MTSTSSNLTPTETRALRAIAVQFFVNGAVTASYIPRLPGIRDQLDTTLSTIGWVIGLATVGGVLGSAIVGPSIDSFGTRRVMMGGAFTIVAVLPFISLVAEPWHLLLLLALHSVADVLTDVAMNMQGSRLSAKRSAPVMNRLHGMWSVGTVIGGLVAALMAAFEVSLGIHLVGAAIVLAAALVYVAPGLLASDVQTAEEVSSARSTAVKGRSVLIFGFLGAAAIVPEMINSDWAAFRLTDDLDASKGLAGIGFVAFTSGMVTGRFAGDTIVARLGGAAVLQRATVVALVGIVTATLVPWIPTVFVGLFIAGIGVSVMFPELYDSAARSPNSARSLGALTAGTRIALFVAPAIVGLLADTATFGVGQAVALVTVPAAVAVLILSRS